MRHRLRYLLLPLWAGALSAQETPPAPQQPPPTLEQRLEEVEKRNRELTERVRTLEEDLDLNRAAAEALAEDSDEGPGLGLTIRRGTIQATVQLFGDVGFEYQNPQEPDRGNAAFFFGGVNLFATAQVGEHFQVLNETVIKHREDVDQDRLVFDQERLWGSWIFSDPVYVKLGLEHGPISRWNRLYHHGRWLETTIERPMLARFETSGGFLPMHNSGLEAGGRLHPSIGRIDYVGVVSNGRGRTPDDPQKLSDSNDAKAFDLGVGFSPACVEGLRVGARFRYDVIAPDEPDREGSIRELIGGASVEYRSASWEMLGEWIYLENRDRHTGETYEHTSGYAQLGYRIDSRWTPYTRFDYRRMDKGDPYFEPLDRDLDRWEQLFGVRFELTRNAAIKLEFGFGRMEEREDSGVERDSYIRTGLQLSWVF